MRSYLFSLSLLVCLISNNYFSQLSFVLSPTVCAGTTLNVSANIGTLTALAYSWAALPAGPGISSSTSPSTSISFSTAGVYTVGLGIFDGTGIIYTTNTLNVLPSPTLTLSSSTQTICPGVSATVITTASSPVTWAPLTALVISGSTVIASPSVTINYTVTSTNSVGCSANASCNVIRSVNPNLTVIATATSVCAGNTSTLLGLGGASYTWTGTSFVGSVNQPSIAVGPGTYTCIVTSAQLCINATTYTITLQSPLNITLSQSSVTTCITSNYPMFSKQILLTANGAATYAWFPDDPNFPMQGPIVIARPSASTCYTVIGSTPGCSGSTIACVQVIPQFSHLISSATAYICAGDQINLSITNIGLLAVGPSSLFTYKWTESGSSGITLSNYLTNTVTAFPQTTTTYTAEVFDSRACVSIPQQITLSVNACTGINQHSEVFSGLKLFPNPVQNKLVIETTKALDLEIELCDWTGKLILRQHSNEEPSLSLDLSGFASGMYFLKLSNKNQRGVYKIIKE